MTIVETLADHKVEDGTTEKIPDSVDFKQSDNKSLVSIRLSNSTAEDTSQNKVSTWPTTPKLRSRSSLYSLSLPI